MSERVASDHPTLRTIEASVESLGATGRPHVVVPGDADERPPTDEAVRLVVDGSVRHAVPVETGTGEVSLRGAYDTPALAREPTGGANRLGSWLDAHDLDVGRTVHLDVLVPGFQYGLRAPGERVVYEVPEPPDPTLSAIADRLDER